MKISSANLVDYLALYMNYRFWTATSESVIESDESTEVGPFRGKSDHM